MSCLVLGLVRWPVVSVPSVLVAQGGYSAWGSGVTTWWAYHSER